MEAWTIDALAQGAGGRVTEAGTRAFNGRVSTDSRKAAAGDLFIAIRGERFDAHAFLPQVFAARVAAVMVHERLSGELMAAAQAHGVSVIRVDDTVRGLNRLAAAYRKGLKAKVIAVGGSNGKTTTKRILHAVLNERALTHASPASFNNNIGMPLTLLETEPHHAFTVLEIGTNAPGEVAALGDVCRPDVAVITNVGLEHLEKLKDLQGVADEEASIAPFVGAGGVVVTVADHPELTGALEKYKVERVTVSLSHDADLRPETTGESAEGVSFGLAGRRFTLPLLGRHNVCNALLAVAVARRFGLSDGQIQDGFGKVTPGFGRMETKHLHGIHVLFDAYNANPSSMEAALATFARLTSARGTFNRKVAVLADMLELGEASAAMHRQIGERAARSNLDRLILIGPAMKHAAAAVGEGAGVETHWFSGTAEARQACATLIGPGDAVLFKGSRGMKLETLLDALTPARPAATTA